MLGGIASLRMPSSGAGAIRKVPVIPEAREVQMSFPTPRRQSSGHLLPEVSTISPLSLSHARVQLDMRLNRPGESGDSTSWEGWSHVRWFVEVNRPGMSGDSVAWEGWGHVSEFVEEVSAGAA